MKALSRILSVAVTVLIFSSGLLAQRADRATLSGVVTDPSGNAVANATVKVLNVNTGVENALQTNDAGAYSSPSLVLGTYSVTVEVPGFKKASRTGIALAGGQSTRQDITMELGSVTEQVTVAASAEVLNTANADVTHTVDKTFYQNLPVVMGADIRLAEALLQLQPGYNPMKPNGDPMFRGSQFQSRLNGGQHSAMENFFDGVAFGYAAGHNQSHESAPPIESVGEMKVITSSFSAQYGHSSGGTVEYSSKGGTKDLHGSFYEYFANDKLNARGFFPDKTSKQRSNAFGWTVGGPVVIPKLYDGRNKTFFFTNWDWLRFRAGVLPGFGNTTPVDAFKRGDFSAGAAIFDPASTNTASGVPQRSPFPGNRIPLSSFSGVASKIVPLMVSPDRAGQTLNVAGNPAGDQTWIGDFRTIMFRLDHNFNDKFKGTTSFFWPHRPSIRNCGEVQGCNTQFDPRTSSNKNDQYFGIGFVQRIATHHATQQFDYIIKNNLLYHATVSWDRWYMGGTPLSAGVGWGEKLWGPQGNGLLDKTAGAPQMTFTGNIPYTTLGVGWTGAGFEAINRWQFSNDLTYIRGRHSLKLGYEFRHHQFNFSGWAANTGGVFNFNRVGTGGYDTNGNSIQATGDPFASFLLGQVHQSNFLIPAFTTFNGNFMAAYLNDEFKVNSKLNLTFGMRIDYQFPWVERFDRMSTFSPTTPNPGAGGRLGALLFAGQGAGKTGSRTFDNTPVDALGPRFGFAYKMNERTVLRGGYGIYYAGVAFGQGSRPTVGYESNPTAANLTNGLTPAFRLDDGFPRNLIRIPPFVDPTFSNGTAPVGYPGDGLIQPRYQNWSTTVQHQIGESMFVEASYIGNKGTRLPHNPQFLGAGYNMNDPSVIRLGTPVLQSDINSVTARNAGIASPYPGFTGIVAQALRPFPQYQAIEWRDTPVGRSRYDSFQIKLDKKFANGLQFRTFYVRARLLNNRAEGGQRGGGGIGVQNPINTQAGEWSHSLDHVPHAFNFSGTYELPLAKNSTGGMAKLLKGWTVNGIIRHDSGRPLAISMNNDLAGLLFNTTKRPNPVSGTAPITEISGRHFDPNADRYLNRGAWVDPGPLQFGTEPSRNVNARGFKNITEDVSMFKATQINERFSLRFDISAGNVTNRVMFCDPATNWSAGNFGQTALQCNQPRSLNLSLKFIY